MSQQDQAGIGKLFSDQKKHFYQFTSQLVNSQFYVRIYYVLIAIQHFQILAFQCHSVYQYKGWGVQWFTTFIHFLNPQYFLKTTNLMNIIIPISFIIVLIHIFLIGFTYYTHKQKGLTKDTVQLKKQKLMIFTHYLTIFVCTILTIPIFQPALLVFYCHSQSPYHQNRQCYDTYHLFLIMMALVNILWLIGINIYYCLLYYTKNPFNYRNPLALSSSLWNLLKFAVKIVPVCYLIFDQVLEYNILYVVGIAAGLVGYTGISRILYPYTRYNKSVEQIIVFIQILSICTSLTFIIQAFFVDSFGFDSIFIVSFIIAVPLANLAFQVSIQKKERIISHINSYQKDNTQTIQNLLSYLIVQIQDQSKLVSEKRFFKVIKLHNDKCENLQCSCHQYLQKFKESHSYINEKQLIYKVFIEIINKMKQVNKKAYSLLLLKSSIEYFKLKNTIKAAYIISKVMTEKITFFEEYLIVGFLYQISKTFQDTSNIEKYRLFSQHLIKFQKQTIKLAGQYQQFWHQIIEQNSSLVKIMNLLKRTSASKKIIDEQFQILYQIYPSNIRISQIYKEVYKQILINYDQFMKFHGIYKDNCLQKDESKLIRQDHQMNFSANEDLIVMNTSVNVSNDIFHGGCEVISVTNNVYKILGYSSRDLVGKNINRFLPKIYTEFHDQFISGYLNKDDGDIKARQLVIFPVNSSGYIVQCAMLNKIMPSLEHGATIVSFLLNSKMSRQNLIIYDQRTGLIDSMSEKAQTLLLGKKAKPNSISIPDHISDILPVWDYIKQETNENKRRTLLQSNQTYTNVSLYRSDGVAQNKYVKVVTFQLAFESKIFTINECISQNQNFWTGFQTLVQNSPYKQNLLKQQKKNGQTGQSNFRGQVGQSPNQSPAGSAIKLGKYSQQSIKKQKQLFKPLPVWYPKLYLIIQVLILLGLLTEIIYNYANTLAYYKVLQNDILIKENIIDAHDLLIEGSHQASQYIFHGSNQEILNDTDQKTAIEDLKQLMTIGQYVYQQIIKKQQKGQFFHNDLMLQVKYFTSPSTIYIKEQTVTDASYQFVLYLLQVYNNSNPKKNLPNNILFLFKNFINISTQYETLNQIFTSNVMKNSKNRKTQVMGLIVGILVVFLVSLIWESIFRLMIASKINSVISIYEAIPIEHLQKYPIKCQNFIKYVCPVETSKDNIPQTVRSIRNLGGILQKNQNKEQVNQFGSFREEEQDETQFVSFTSHFSIWSIVFQSIAFLLLFSIFYVVELTNENKLLNENLVQVWEWNNIVNVRGQLLKLIYFNNEHKNFQNQWNGSQLLQIDSNFNQTKLKIQNYLNVTSKVDLYLSQFYQLLQQSEFIFKNDSVTASQLLTNQEKIFNLTDSIQNELIDPLIEQNTKKTIISFLDVVQLLLVGQIIVFLAYCLIYIPKVYKIYLQRNQITQLMYNTLGFRLQSIAKSNFINH